MFSNDCESAIRNPQSAIRNRQFSLIVVAAGLMTIGLVMVASTTISLDPDLWDLGRVDNAHPTALWSTPFRRQAVFVLAGFVVMVITARLAVPVLSSPIWRHRAAHIMFVVALAGLVAAMIPGLADPHRGSHRWVRFAPGGFEIGFQPSEFAKVAMVAFLASWLTRPGTNLGSFRMSFLPAAVALGACVFLVGAEDFSTAVLLACVGVSMLFVGGCRFRHLLGAGAVGVCGMTVLLFMSPYRLARITAYQDFWADPQGAGYQPLQSLAAIASGGWLGQGLGYGVQKYGYLPDSHTDFIFAGICEEMGVFGGGLVITLFCMLVWLGLRTMWTTRSRFEGLLAFGLAASIGLQATMNIAVVTVVTPTTGIPLPLVSAGGSGVLATCLAVGLLAAIAKSGERRIANAE